MTMTTTTIQSLIDLDYATDVRKARRKTGEKTQEFFTPWAIVEKMCKKIPQEDWRDPTKTFLEPCFGNGNFVVAIVYFRLHAKVKWRDALNTLYGVELMQDNVDECKERVLDLLDKLCIKYDREEAKQIMDKNLICHDFFTWNFQEWREYTPEELKQIEKDKKKKK